MTKRTRQKAIMDIVGSTRVYSFADMLKELAKRGCKVNTSTLCRDIAQMQIVKTVEGYRPLREGADYAEALPSMVTTIQQTITGIRVINNLAVIHTIAGGAQVVARLLDTTPHSHLVGTVAGDDTILGIAENKKEAKAFFKWLSGKIEAS